MYGAFKCLVSGIFLVALGLWLIFSPTFRNDPNKITAADILPGAGAILVGVLLFAGACLVLFGGNKKDPSKDD